MHIISGETRPQVDQNCTYSLFTFPTGGNFDPVENVKWTLSGYFSPIIKEGLSVNYTFYADAVNRYYTLKAEYTTKSGKAGTLTANIIPVAGVAKIKSLRWEDCNFDNVTGKTVGYLDTLYLIIETENIPANDKLKITLYEDELVSGHGDSSIELGTFEATVGKNGKAEIILSSALLQQYQKKLNDLDWFDDSVHDYYAKVEYLGKLNTIYDTTQVKVKNKLEQLIYPRNARKPVTVTSTGATPIGIVKVMKAKFNTTYDVCSDGVKNFTDYENFYVLESRGVYDYHWLANGTRTTSDKAKKPDPIPITYSSYQTVTVKITFVSETEKSITLRLSDTNKKYSFPIQHKNRGKGEFEVEFICPIAPYAGTIQYFETYEFRPEYAFEEDGIWKSMNENIKVRLYITKNNPLWSKYDTIESISGRVINLSVNSTTTLRLECAKNSYKKNIVETLLFLSCKSNPSSYTEENIVKSIFKQISPTPLKVFRARQKTEALGYWRNSSALQPNKFSPIRAESFTQSSRSVRFLLRIGEARCGEWAQFFTALCQTQGIDGVKQLPFKLSNKTLNGNPGYISSCFLVKTWKTPDPHRPIDQGGKAQGNNKPMNVFGDHVFSVYNNQFYDPSYGLKGQIQHSSWEEILKEYSPIALQGIPFSKIDTTNGEEFYDNIHSELYLDTQHFNFARTPSGVPKFLFKTLKLNIQTYFDLTY